MPPRHASIDAESASAIIARRRGLTSSRYVGSVDAAKLQELDYYGGWQQPLLADDDAAAGPGRLFIRIVGYNGGFDGLANAPLPDLWIEKPTRALKTDFAARDRKAEAVCEYAVPPSKNHANSKGDLGCLAAAEIPTIPLVLTLYSVLPETAAGVSQAIGPLIRILKHMSATQGVESTILLLPSKLTAGTAGHGGEIKKRASETPLDLPLLPTLSPVEYSSGVSGHASNQTLPGVCSPTVERVYDDGSQKTVHWGGHACEKKDVSVPFIIFASFGVAFTALIAGGIALLFSMGGEALPSVLSAGVAGPTARR
ncbi:hypothetical protein DV737_g4013, partial [Chaetothyriales sp. CBS 132003]